MPLSRGSKAGILFRVLGSLLGIATVPVVLLYGNRPAPPKESLTMRLDPAGPYSILATKRAARDYAVAIATARKLHPGAEQNNFDPSDLQDLSKFLRERQPRYAIVFIMPEELDVNFVWRWLTMTSRLDDDPFVDVSVGFITGATPEATLAFVERIATVVEGRLRIPGACIDNLGPPEQGDQQFFYTLNRPLYLPALENRFSLQSLTHGKGGFTDDRLSSMDGAGLVHFGGHGHPDRIDDGLTAGQIPRLKLSPCIIFSGACYTGVTNRWYDQASGKVAERSVATDNSFCLNLLCKDVIAYLAAVHPDHGIPVYQELEYLAYRGASLGDVMKFTYDGIVIGAGGTMPAFEPLKDGMILPGQVPSEVMLKGTAARILLGDPALVVCDAFTPSPFTTTVTEETDALRVRATLANPILISTFTDTYHNDLSPQAPYNDRALLSIDLPTRWKAVDKVEVVDVQAGGHPLAHRLIGFAVEHHQGNRRLHVQVDVLAQGFQQSAFRVAGATVECVVRPKR